MKINTNDLAIATFSGCRVISQTESNSVNLCEICDSVVTGCSSVWK